MTTQQRLFKTLPLVCLLLLVAISARGEERADRLTGIRIDNFGQINANYYRGGQPDKKDYTDLAALGVRTVIDLINDESGDEQKLVERAGMKFVHIPLTTWDRPSDAAVKKFLEIVNDAAEEPVFVHCREGRHRTGIMTAVYRMTQDHWTADKAYAEMKRYRFEGLIGHSTLKKFVYEYYARLQAAEMVKQ